VNIKDEDPPVCKPCNSLLTIEHTLISCVDFDIIRQNFYTASYLKDLFRNIRPILVFYAPLASLKNFELFQA